MGAVNSNMSSSGAKSITCDAGLGQEENQVEATDCERAITIALKQDVFCFADLVKLSLVNKNLNGEIRQDHVWKPFLHTNRLGFGNAGIVIDDSEWPDKNIPPLENHTLMIPPRIRVPVSQRLLIRYHPKKVRDISPHPEEVRGDLNLGPRFNQETGAIADLVENWDGTSLTYRYLPHPLPVQCSICCNGFFENNPDFVRHLKSSGHIRRMTIYRYGDIEVDEWYDPRLYDDFDTMTCFEQVHALFEFKAKVLRKLRGPMSDLVIQRMDDMLKRLCISNNIQNILDSTDERAGARKRLIRAVTDMAEEYFTHHGVKECCLDFLKDFLSEKQRSVFGAYSVGTGNGQEYGLMVKVNAIKG
jgi:hypothetical protein